MCSIWIAFLVLLCFCEEIQAIKCHEGIQVGAEPITTLGEAHIACSEDSIQLLWNFKIPNDQIRYYQVEYQCSESITYNFSDNIIVRDLFEQDYLSPQALTVSNVSGTHCVMVACVGIENRRGIKTQWLGNSVSCQLNADVPVNSSVTSFHPTLSHLITPTTHSYSTTVYMPPTATITTIATTTAALMEISPTNYLESTPLANTVQNTIIVAAVSTLVFVLFLFIVCFLAALCIRCHSERRNEKTLNVEFLNTIQIVRTDSNVSLKTVVCSPVQITTGASRSSSISGSEGKLSDESMNDTDSNNKTPYPLLTTPEMLQSLRIDSDTDSSDIKTPSPPLLQPFGLSDESDYLTVPLPHAPYIMCLCGNESPNNVSPIATTSTESSSSGYGEDLVSDFYDELIIQDYCDDSD